jgi:hypothetical protein
MNEQTPEWIIQRRIHAFRDEYEDWPGYCERLLTREEMKAALAQCNERGTDYAFRGHNVVNQRRKCPTLRLVK